MVPGGNTPCSAIVTKYLDFARSSKMFVFPSFTVYKAETSFDGDGDKKVCLYKCFAIKTLYLGWVPNHIDFKIASV